ncbi:protein DpdE [Dactylosporangium darangshiense]|uniref:ATP-dependent helicase HepA n=1 Tax=Dactylosporangium darangshiense TaxID=579108 RepID=A0ABP8CTK7_9ACTN
MASKNNGDARQHPARVPSANPSGFAPGQFVQHPRVPGIVKIGARTGDRLEVEAFESVAEPVAATWSLPADQCRLVRLPVETRVYWRDLGTGTWHAGRVVGGGPDDYGVRFPNRKFAALIPSGELWVRWHRPVRSPIEVLATGANESPYYRDARLPMLRSLLAQRAAAANFSALLSSAIEIYPHQIDAALTVLTDPVQRYLLADEVGLGKTIEAGLVIRQHLIDHPTARIAILAPDILRRQWSSELRSKFFTEDFRQAEIRIGQHETPESWVNYHGFDLVVIDEVHNLTRTGNPHDEPYPQLAALARAVPRLILLSATPGTARPELHLSLLHLLDHHLYRWEDLPQFRQRFADRRRLANAVHGLNANLEMLLPDVLSDIAELIPDDAAFAQLAHDLRQFLTEDDELHDEADRPRLAAAIEVLRAHISETYRLHRRMIRHRRSHVLRARDEDLLPFEVRGRSHPAEVVLGGQRVDLAHQALLGWQQGVAQWLLDHDDRQAREFGQVLAVLASRVDELSDDLPDALRWRLDGDAAAADRAGLSVSERKLLRNTAPLPLERQTLTELVNTLGTATPRLNGLAQAIKGARRPVVFCGSGQMADNLAAVLARRTRWTVLRHTRSRPAAEVTQDLDHWRNGGAILLVDDSGEDGVNLQDADVVIHLRLPWSPNRLEQRLGRVDRFAGYFGAQGEPATQYCDTGGSADESFSAAWCELLVRAFGAFDGSLSALQDILDELQAQAWEVALRDGPTAMTALADKISTALGQERREIEAMDALESIHDATLGLRMARKINQLEQQWTRHEGALRALINSSGGGLRLTIEPPTGPVATIGFDHRNPPLISPVVLAQEAVGLPRESMTGTFNRNVSLRERGVRLFRVGNPLIELLAAVMAIDDRGQASALWRPGRSEESVYFGFDVVVEADLEAALTHPQTGAESRYAIRRQADLLLPPFIDRVWLDAAGAQVTDEALLSWLNAPYSNQRDVNLNPDRITPLLDSFGGVERFAAAARLAEATARDLVTQGERLRKRTAAAHDDGSRTLAIQRAQALARQAAGRLLSDTEDYVTNIELSGLLIDGLRRPKVRVVAAACVAGGDLWGLGHVPR